MDPLIFSAGGARLLAHSGEPRRLATGFFFTEGPVWDAAAGRLYFTNFSKNEIYTFAPGETPKLWRRNANRAVGLSMTANGTLVAAETASHAVTLAYADHSRVIAGRFDGKTLNSPNDVVVRRDGAVFFTDPYSKAMNGPRELDFNGFYRVPFHGGVYGEAELLGIMGRPNGLAFSPDESVLYVNDTDLNRIDAYAMRADGAASPIGVFAQLDAAYGPGVADGMKVDTVGNVYVTGPGGVWALDSAGAPLGLIRLEEPAGNLCFGGADNAALFITATASVYSVRVGVPGIIPYREGGAAE